MIERNYQWWYDHYIAKGMSASEIANEYGLSISTVKKKLSKLKISKRANKFCDKEWLEGKLLNEKMTLFRIGKEAGVSKTTIRRWIDKFGIRYDEDLKTEIAHAELNRLEAEVGKGFFFQTDKFKAKRKNSMMERYGVEHPLQNDEIYQKLEKTMIKSYGVRSPMQSEEIRARYAKSMLAAWGVPSPLMNKELAVKMVKTTKDRYSVSLYNDNISDKIHIRTIDGLDLKSYARKHKIGYTTLTAFLRGKETVKEGEIEAFLKRLRDGVTDIEKKFSEELGFDKFDKTEPWMCKKYRPDFKIDDDTYVNVDGLYWHSEFMVDKNYHFNMRKSFEKNNKRIFQIRADEIIDDRKFEIIKSMIKNNLGESTKIFGRKTSISKVSHKEASEFLDRNHLMGSVKAKHIGLYNKDMLVCILSYKEYKNKVKVERFCSEKDCVVIGGFSKLLKKLQGISNKDIHYWVDLRYGTGSYLERFGFEFARETLGWKWTDFRHTYNRLSCRANMDERKLSQKEHASEMGYSKIYDAGQRLFVKRGESNDEEAG